MANGRVVSPIYNFPSSPQPRVCPLLNCLCPLPAPSPIKKTPGKVSDQGPALEVSVPQFDSICTFNFWNL